MNFWKNFLFELKNLEKMGAKVFCVGKSVLKRPIFCVQIGNGEKRILVQYAIHAREHITTHLAFLQAKKLLSEKVHGTVFLIPLSNPDGVCLATEGLKSLENLWQDVKLCENLFPFCEKSATFGTLKLKKIKQNLLKMNNNSPDFSLWKANILGVDLNVNFDAHWGKGKFNVFSPAPQNHVGKHSNSEPETQTLIFALKITKPHMTISYHSKGEMIFWRFFQDKNTLKKHKIFAKEISKQTGYALKKSPKSVGGFKDFCIEKFGLPSLTIEVGSDKLKHPILKKHILKIWKQNENVITKSLALLNGFDV